ncbi:MAG: sugar ABC transporter permease [Chloroflexi bacterium UTCFX4]|nr:MAG: sugar ABC transporter permease [Chloroflexi bacterium UTCFX4]
MAEQTQPSARPLPRWTTETILYAVLLIGGIVMVIPFIWMLATSLKPAKEIFLGNFFPLAPTFENYQIVLKKVPFARWYLNSLIVATLTTLSVAFFDSLVGFTLAKYEFRGKNVIFIFILSTLMVPTEMLIIPWFILSNNFHWVDTYWGIMFPGMMSAFGIFLMKQFMEGIPSELLDAARIDGVSEFGLFWRIAMPLVRPALAALCIFTFLGNWNAFLWPVIITEKMDMRTIPVGLSFFSGEAGASWELIMAGAAMATIPVLIVFVIFQRQIIKGIALTGLKG